MPTPIEETESPIRRCGCGNAIGDGDYASGQRKCAPCRRPRYPTQSLLPRIPTPRR